MPSSISLYTCGYSAFFPLVITRAISNFIRQRAPLEHSRHRSVDIRSSASPVLPYTLIILNCAVTQFSMETFPATIRYLNHTVFVIGLDSEFSSSIVMNNKYHNSVS